MSQKRDIGHSGRDVCLQGSLRFGRDDGSSGEGDGGSLDGG